MHDMHDFDACIRISTERGVEYTNVSGVTRTGEL